MKAFLKNIGLFLLLLIGINVILYVLIEHIYIKDYYKVDLNQKEYLLADSHGYHVGDLNETNGIYNLSQKGDSYEDLKRKLTFLIRNSEIERLYLSVDDHTLSPSREDSNNKELSVYFTQHQDFESYGSYINEKYLKRYVVYFNSKYSSILKHFFKNKLASMFSSAQEPVAWSKLSKEEKNTLSNERFNTYFTQKNQSKKLLSSLITIIDLCKKNNVELIGVKFPLTSSYNNVLGKNNFKADSLFNEKNLHVLDFKEAFLKQDSLFIDQDHLNTAGEKAFKKLLLKYQNR